MDPLSLSLPFRYHDMDGVLDFLILETTYKAGLRHQWTQGDRFRSMIDSSYWTGRVREYNKPQCSCHRNKFMYMYIY